MTGVLGSVASRSEADLLVSLGVDILDLKDPSRGALGALVPDLITEIVAAHPNACISATLGDLPMQADLIEASARATMQLGVHHVKIGFFPGGHWQDILFRLEDSVAGSVSLIAVLLADQAAPDLDWIPRFAASGFSGIMLDTADKVRGSLTDLVSSAFLAEFIQLARDCGLMTGLAGSLQAADIPLLLPLEPSYLGFRGALCERGRDSSISAARAAAVIRSVRAG
jgi:uncharacterized protein (UPF0264 family)